MADDLASQMEGLNLMEPMEFNAMLQEAAGGGCSDPSDLKVNLPVDLSCFPTTEQDIIKECFKNGSLIASSYSFAMGSIEASWYKLNFEMIVGFVDQTNAVFEYFKTTTGMTKTNVIDSGVLGMKKEKYYRLRAVCEDDVLRKMAMDGDPRLTARFIADHKQKQKAVKKAETPKKSPKKTPTKAEVIKEKDAFEEMLTKLREGVLTFINELEILCDVEIVEIETTHEADGDSEADPRMVFVRKVVAQANELIAQVEGQEPITI